MCAQTAGERKEYVTYGFVCQPWTQTMRQIGFEPRILRSTDKKNLLLVNCVVITLQFIGKLKVFARIIVFC